MLEKEFRSVLHLEHYNIEKLIDAFNSEKSRCENENQNSNPQDLKGLTLWNIVSLSRSLWEFRERRANIGNETIDQNLAMGSYDSKPKDVFETIKKNEYYRQNFSKAYQIIYAKTVLNYIYRNNSIKNKLDYFLNNWNDTIGVSLPNLFIIIRLLSPSYFDVSSTRILLRVEREIRDFIKKSKYISNDVESFQLIIELSVLAFKTDEESTLDCNNTANCYVYTYISLELYTSDRASEGIPFAKEGLFVRNIKYKADAFNALGLCAASSYGKLQLAYDVYFSWINNKVVGELVELFEKNEEKKILPLETESKDWIQDDTNFEKVSIIYNNLAYVCGTIADTYDILDERRRAFLFTALENIEKAIHYNNKDADYYKTKSIIQYRIGLLETFLAPSDENRFSETLLTALEYLEISSRDYTEDKKQIYEAQSNYADFLLEWLLEAYQVFMRRYASKHSVAGGVQSDLSKFSNFCSDKLVSKNFNKFFKIFSQMKNISQILVRSRKNAPKKDDSFEKDKWEPFLLMRDFIDYNTRQKSVDKARVKLNEWQLLLMLIHRSATAIKSQLRRQDYSSINYSLRDNSSDEKIKQRRNKICPIAYYTTLGNIKFLFEPVTESQALGISDGKSDRTRKSSSDSMACKDSTELIKENKKNCFTLMHVRHMNDPLEGLMLPRILFNDIEETRFAKQNILFANQTPESYREEIFDRNYIFLKAFTERLDKLDMWNRYASDRSSGKDSNGCCVEVNPETFNRKDKDSEQRTKRLPKLQDDFNLYKILYLTDDGQILYEKKDTNLFRYYDAFKDLIVTLNSFLNDKSLRQSLGIRWSDLIETTNRTVEDVLKSVMFLFKPDAYAEEKESRIIFIKTSDQRDSFHSIETLLPKLFITPFRQVYVDKITLGPKAESPDHWLPYLQYKIDGMRQVIQEDLDEGTRISYFPEKISVRKSTIPYQD